MSASFFSLQNFRAKTNAATDAMDVDVRRNRSMSSRDSRCSAISQISSGGSVRRGEGL